MSLIFSCWAYTYVHTLYSDISIYFITGDIFFDPAIRNVTFPAQADTVVVQITLFPEEVENMDLQFIVTLAVPAAAMAQGVILGAPSVATVTVPATR